MWVQRFVRVLTIEMRMFQRNWMKNENGAKETERKGKHKTKMNGSGFFEMKNTQLA